MSDPIWKDVVGYEGIYQVSNTGMVRRPEGNDSIGRPRRSRVLSLCDDARGYFVVSLSANAMSRSARVHTLVAQAFLGERPAGHVVNHKNGNKRDNRDCNLEWVTVADNDRHAAFTGLKASGERHGMAKLAAEQVDEIRTAFALNGNKMEVGRRFGVHPRTVGRIVDGTAWKAAFLPPLPEILADG